MEITIQEPTGSTDFTVSPEGNRFVDSAGFNSYLYQYPDLDPESTIQFDITYTRTATAPSLSSSEENETSDYTLILVILAAIVVIIVAVFVRQRRKTPVTRAERRRSARKNDKPVMQDSTPAPKFCSQCGNPVEKNHTFCPSCGSKIQ